MVQKLTLFEGAIRSINGKTFTIEADSNGMFDKECPNISCRVLFKVSESAWTDKASGEKRFCPHCGIAADRNDFLPTSQIENAMEELHEKIASNWTNDEPIPQNITTVSSSPSMKEVQSCSKCQSTFSTSGLSNFCPYCSHKMIVDQ